MEHHVSSHSRSHLSGFLEAFSLQEAERRWQVAGRFFLFHALVLEKQTKRLNALASSKLLLHYCPGGHVWIFFFHFQLPKQKKRPLETKQSNQSDEKLLADFSKVKACLGEG